MLQFPGSLSQLRLDIVGIVAVLGEGCTSRTLQVSALSWPHVLPRLLPAPQALLRHEQLIRLPVQDGMVIGAYSGNTERELNFFCQLLHHKSLSPYKVELLEVKPKLKVPRSDGQAFGARHFSWLSWLSGLGCLMAFGLIAMSIYYEDGFALVATVALAATSSIVGFASRWKLRFKEPQPRAERKKVIPHSDVIIRYPNGSFRIVRCPEPIARLYFEREICESIADDNEYRIAALLASVLLMGGLLCMGNAQPYLQIAFAASYILLNIFHWAVSALNPFHYHWESNYDVVPIQFKAPLKKKKRTDVARNDSDKANQYKSAPGTNEVRGNTINGNPTATSSSREDQLARQEDIELPEIGIKRRKTGTITFETEVTIGADGEVLSPPRRKNTDLEGNRKRVILPPRSYTAPLEQTLNLIRRVSSYLTKIETPEETEEDRGFTSALWQVIALTGTGRWLKNTLIAPNTDVWEEWIDMAASRAIPKKVEVKDESGEIERTTNNKSQHVVPATTKDEDGAILLPIWDYQGALNKLLAEEKKIPVKGRPPTPEPLSPPNISKLTEDVKTRLKQLAQIARERAKMRSAVHAFRNPLYLRKKQVKTK